MADLKGTSGRDVFVITNSRDTYDGLDGDDEITIKADWGTAQGGTGNDTNIVNTSIRPFNATVWYWLSSKPTLADFQSG